jgi:HSP20 family molecular chaperone IbpA
MTDCGFPVSLWTVYKPVLTPRLEDLDRRLNQMRSGNQQNAGAIESGQGQQGQQSQGGQLQQTGQQGGQMTSGRDRFRNSLLAGRGFKVDVSETPQNYIVRADLPGVDKKDIKVEVVRTVD